MPDSHLIIVYDNHPGIPEPKSLWGFAAVTRLPGRTILFDTGSNGRVLLANMAALGLAPEELELVFLSHPHGDHIGRLDSILELSPHAMLVVHDGFSKHLVHDLRGLCRKLIVIDGDPQPLAPSVFSTGRLDSESAKQTRPWLSTPATWLR